jgi:hypothetical protein
MTAQYKHTCRELPNNNNNNRHLPYSFVYDATIPSDMSNMSRLSYKQCSLAWLHPKSTSSTYSMRKNVASTLSICELATKRRSATKVKAKKETADSGSESDGLDILQHAKRVKQEPVLDWEDDERRNVQRVVKKEEIETHGRRLAASSSSSSSSSSDSDESEYRPDTHGGAPGEVEQVRVETRVKMEVEPTTSSLKVVSKTTTTGNRKTRSYNNSIIDAIMSQGAQRKAAPALHSRDTIVPATVPPDKYFKDVVTETLEMLFKHQKLYTANLLSDTGPLKETEMLNIITYVSAEHESACMRQAGSYISPEAGFTIHTPACANGVHCIARSDRIQGFERDNLPGVVLMTYMTPEDLRSHCETGRVPKSIHPCVLCRRHLLTNAALNFRAKGLEWPRESVIHGHRNSVDKPGGYHTEYCLVPSQSKWNGIMFPVASYRMDKLRAVKDRNGVWWIDQSSMCYQPSPPPFSVS